MHDETDMTVEPRRRENTGRRGYSPRRTQSNCNRVEMYFSEVDVDVRQPRPRDPIASLTNIRSSDDISSGYSSGEALQSHRMTSHTESLLRTSSVGARTRSSKPRAATKKAPENLKDEEENWELASGSNHLPLTLSEISAKQALELLFLLTRVNIPYSRSEPKLTEIHENQTDTKCEEMFCDASSSEGVTIHKEMSEIPQIDFEMTENPVKLVNPSRNSPEVSDCLEETARQLSQIDMTKITEEICQEKMSELKRLLSDAHSAVSSLANSQEDLRIESKADSAAIESPDANTVDIWTTPKTSRSNSESHDRAGKYNKKPAPRAPVAHPNDHRDEVEAQPLKATLVLKPGTVKTLTHIDSAVKSIPANPASPLSTKKKGKVKDGFSKFLTIPKNLFHTTFHKDQRDDDTSSVSTRSRSTSLDLHDDRFNMNDGTRIHESSEKNARDGALSDHQLCDPSPEQKDNH